MMSGSHIYGQPKPGKDVLTVCYARQRLMTTADASLKKNLEDFQRGSPVKRSSQIFILAFISDLSVFPSEFTYPLFVRVEPVQVRSIHMK